MKKPLTYTRYTREPDGVYEITDRWWSLFEWEKTATKLPSEHPAAKMARYIGYGQPFVL